MKRILVRRLPILVGRGGGEVGPQARGIFFLKPRIYGDFTIAIIANAPLSAFAQKLEDSERRRFNRTTLEFMNRLEEVMV